MINNVFGYIKSLTDKIGLTSSYTYQIHIFGKENSGKTTLFKRISDKKVTWIGDPFIQYFAKCKIGNMEIVH